MRTCFERRPFYFWYLQEGKKKKKRSSWANLEPTKRSLLQTQNQEQVSVQPPCWFRFRFCRGCSAPQPGSRPSPAGDFLRSLPWDLLELRTGDSRGIWINHHGMIWAGRELRDDLIPPAVPGAPIPLQPGFEHFQGSRAATAALPPDQLFLSLTCLSIKTGFTTSGNTNNTWLQVFNHIFVSSLSLLSIQISFSKHSYSEAQELISLPPILPPVEKLLCLMSSCMVCDLGESWQRMWWIRSKISSLEYSWGY